MNATEKYGEKRLLKMFLTAWGKDTDQTIIARSLTFLIFEVGWALRGRPQPEHESVIPLLSQVGWAFR